MHKLKETEFGEISPLLQRERTLDVSKIQHIQGLFWDLHFLRKPSSGGIEPFDPQRIESHFKLLGEKLSKWEYKTLMEMDLIFRGTVMRQWEK